MTLCGTLIMKRLERTGAPEFHRPVLVAEVISLLDPRTGGRYFDGTLGGGGHAKEILSASGPDGELWGVDLDEDAVRRSREALSEFPGRTHLFQGNYSQAEYYLGENRIEGAILDLGVSSYQIDRDEKGFTYQRSSPLDMRYDRRSGVTASAVLNTYSEDQLADIFFRYGEERRSRKIARSIVRERAKRPIEDSLRLKEIVTRTVPRDYNQKSVARIFQALRIYVNGELTSLELGLGSIFRLLREGGRFAVISYHSLEDRIVKTHFRYLEADCICPSDVPECRCRKVRMGEILTRRPVRSSLKEREANPRARGAKLRAVQKVTAP
jgi:16S rRNA (cytosine1402-N4)-methyltransferase